MNTRMSCSGIDDVLDARADGTLEASIAAAMDQHLGRCGPCRRYSEAYFATLRALDALRSTESARADPMPPRLTERVLASVRPESPRHGAIADLSP